MAISDARAAIYSPYTVATPDIRARSASRRAGEPVAVPITPIRLGDVVRLKKPHPCGTNEWEINRLGADIRLKCQGCGRSVMLERYEFDRRFRGFVTRANEEPEVGEDAPVDEKLSE
jgi:hypothetical protein